ncbi:NAD(P)H-hydrate dehydratase [Bacteroidota bacterium]
MKIFPAEVVQEIDRYTIEHEPVQSIDLMERAASKLTEWFVKRFKTNESILIFAGPGNNGGDALALARMLIERRYIPRIFLVAPSGKLSQDCRINLNRLKEVKLVEVITITASEDFPEISSSDLIVDGLFGSGLTRAVEGLYSELISFISASDPRIISIDVPSGLFGEDNTDNRDGAILRAAYTLTFQFPFLSFMFAENAQYTGEWHVLDIGLHPMIIEKTDSAYILLERLDIAGMIKQRAKFDHKGRYGHVLAIAGSYGMMGAAVLASEAALRAGAGLVSAHIPRSGYLVMQSAVPEVIVSPDESEAHISGLPDLSKYNAIAVGPGLGIGEETGKVVYDLIESTTVPLIIDADALNILAAAKYDYHKLPGKTILTPHPGEFDRLAGKSSTGWERHQKQIRFSKEFGVIIVLKGANTGISFPDGRYFFNSTGNPGMATGGSGDVLTGIIASLLARGMKPEKAALAGVYLHGLAGDLAADTLGQEALIAGDITRHLGEAFKKILANPFLHEGRTGGIIQ